MTQSEFFTSLANGAKWGVPATISRSGSNNGGLPIDAYSIFDSKEKAELYASQHKAAVEEAGMVNNAYIGQIITVWEKVPALGEDGSPTTIDDVSVYYIDADKTLKPVGIIPTGDSKTIEVTTEGAISLKSTTNDYNKLAKIDSSGNLIWISPYSGSTDISIDTSNKISLAGVSDTNISKVPKVSDAGDKLEWVSATDLGKSGDGSSIIVADTAFSIKGYADANPNTIPQKTATGINWVAPSAIAPTYAEGTNISISADKKISTSATPSFTSVTVGTAIINCTENKITFDFK